MGNELMEGIAEVPEYHVASVAHGKVRASPLAKKLAASRGGSPQSLRIGATWPHS